MPTLMTGVILHTHAHNFSELYLNLSPVTELEPLLTIKHFTIYIPCISVFISNTNCDLKEINIIHYPVISSLIKQTVQVHS